jgi:hypothetical protein
MRMSSGKSASQLWYEYHHPNKRANCWSCGRFVWTITSAYRCVYCDVEWNTQCWTGACVRNPELMNTPQLNPTLIDATREADEFAKQAEAYGAAVTAFGDAAARIFERHEELKGKLVAEAVDQFDGQFAEFESDEPLNIRLARVTSSAQIEEAV